MFGRTLGGGWKGGVRALGPAGPGACDEAVALEVDHAVDHEGEGQKGGGVIWIVVGGVLLLRVFGYGAYLCTLRIYRRYYTFVL